MKINWCKNTLINLILISCAMGVTDLQAQQENSARVILADKYSVKLSSGPVLSFSELKWVTDKTPWTSLIGKEVSYEYIALNQPGEVNRYQETHAKIISEDLGWVQSYWVKQGLAVLKGMGGLPTEVRKDLLRAEAQARNSKFGYWRNNSIQGALNFPERRLINEFKIVRGIVANTRTIRGTTYLNFGENWKIDFTAAISSRNRANFKKEDWKLTDLTNKWIQVRGRVREFNGPYMELIFPEQVEILEQ